MNSHVSFRGVSGGFWCSLFSKFQRIFGGFQRRHAGVFGFFKSALNGVRGIVGAFRRYFRKLQSISDGFHKRYGGIFGIFLRVSAALHGVRGGPREISEAFHEVSEDFQRPLHKKPFKPLEIYLKYYFVGDTIEMPLKSPLFVLKCS